MENLLQFLIIYSTGDQQNYTFFQFEFSQLLLPVNYLLCSPLGKSKHSNQILWFSARALWSHFLLHEVSWLFLVPGYTGTLNSRYFQSFFTRSLWSSWKDSSPECPNCDPKLHHQLTSPSQGRKWVMFSTLPACTYSLQTSYCSDYFNISWPQSMNCRKVKDVRLKKSCNLNRKLHSPVY